MPRFLFSLLAVTFLLIHGFAFAAKPVYQSPIVSSATPGHAVKIEVKIEGAKQLYLVVSDAGDGFGCDWADWGNPVLVGKSGEKKLTDLKWKSASSGFAEVRAGRNCQGQPLQVAGRKLEDGIGTHANSIIVYDLPEGFTTFRAEGCLDDGGTRQGCGSTVKFLVFTEKPDANYLTASTAGDAETREPESALEGLDVGEGLEATLFASEPMLFSPSNIDIDHRGRVWVCEVVNYRHFRNTNNTPREAGDRILILEDTDGDGVADSQKVFYQSPDIDSAHGVCVLDNLAIVSAGDSVYLLTDTDRDDKADKVAKLFSGIAGTQHDHGIHSFLFGPDGKLYFNFGNAGKYLYDAKGEAVRDKSGRIVRDDRQPYQEGMVFRCNMDGSEVETLGWNFRNNWEVTVDSFGSMWQSDNDDDGNRGVRINFVMEYGNYGYKDELTGAGWRDPRTGMHEEIPLRHWHLNDPGVVPNLLQTGAGSPTGIMVYEGTLLPERFHNQLIHCDAGPNVVRAYLTEKAGAGYEAEISDILVGTRDKWFRPSDVCVAPDGSLIVADWYDPGVGGHAQGDIQRGRLFRIAPPKAAYKTPQFDFDSVAGAIDALRNPNLAARYMAWTSLHKQGVKARPELWKVFTEDPDPRMRARAMWLLGKIESTGPETVDAALKSDHPDIRIAGLRLARQLDLNLVPIVKRLANDPAPEVRRECCVALVEIEGDQVPGLWAELAIQLVPEDRWMLEALGIAARDRWDACLAAYLERHPDIYDAQAGFLIWRSRAAQTPQLLARLIDHPEVPGIYLPFLFRAFDFQNTPDKQEILIAIAFGKSERTSTETAFVRAEALDRIANLDLQNHPERKASLNDALESLQGTMQYVKLVDRFNLTERFPVLLKLAQEQTDTELGVAAAGTLLDKQQWKLLDAALNSEEDKLALATLEVLGNTGKGNIQGLLMPFVQKANLDIERRRQAVRSLAKTRNGALKLVELAKQKELDQNLTQVAAASLHSAQWRDVQEQAEKLFPPPPSKNNKPLPPVTELLARRGDVNNGKLVFNSTGTCSKCHIVNEIGKEVGPNLSEIGSKLSRIAMFESILFPSAGVSHNYETHVVVTDDGASFTGVLVSETPDTITLKGADAIPRTLKKSAIEEHITQKVSLMPADLQKLMTEEDLVDVVDYMQSLKKKQ